VGLRRPRARRRLVRGGVRPSSEAEARPRGRQALERGGESVARRLVLERDGDSPEGYRGLPFGGPLRLLGPWALRCFGPRPRETCFTGLFVCLLLFFERGVFPGY
jgi:hypothetical protein